MKLNKTPIILALIGLVSALSTVWLSSNSQPEDQGPDFTGQQAEAVFAGGCFWCVESDFDKVPGVIETISGYTGGTLEYPTYAQVSYEETGHYEAVKVIYDPTKVSYSELVDYFWRHVDPTDAGGQFCDRGSSYRTAIFASSDSEIIVAEASKSVINGSGLLDDPIVTPILPASKFWPAEDYHQNFQTNNPLRYSTYRNGCGRDQRLRHVWRNDTPDM